MTKWLVIYWKIPLLILFTFFINSDQLFGQIEVEPAITAPFTPESLVTDVLKGDGIIIDDVKFHGVDPAVGYFSDGKSSIGLDKGIILTTGWAFSASSPTAQGEMGTSGQNRSTAQSPELESLADTILHDISYFEITFTPLSDSIEFNYVFGSEEYPEFGCDCYNDVFGFFIFGNGYDPAGENIALLPNTNLPVSVKTIHPIDTVSNNGVGCNNTNTVCQPTNEHLYIDNSNGVEVNYDGFTTILTARAKVEKCSQYVLKIGIADVSDQVWDSGVFLEANSFSSNSLGVATNTPNLDGTIVEGCSDAELVFSIPNPKDEDLVVNFTTNPNSTAIPGEDFEPFPTSVTIPAGETTFAIPVRPIEDDITEDKVDSLGIDLEINECYTQTVWIPIRDKELIISDLGDDWTICPGDTIHLDAEATGLGEQPYLFSSDTANALIPLVRGDIPEPSTLDPGIFTLEVSGIEPGKFVPGLIEEVCINISHPILHDVDVFMVSPSGKIIELTTDNGGAFGSNYTNTCFTPNAFTSIKEEAAPYTGQFQAEGSLDDLLGTQVNGTWQLIVRDDNNAGNVNGVFHYWSIKFTDNQDITYDWEVADSISCLDCPNPIVFPSETTQYKLTATDIYGCAATDEVTINVDQGLPAPIVRCEDADENSVLVTWDAVVGAVNYSVNVEETGWINPNMGAMNHQVTGLSKGDTIQIQVRANNGGTCPTAVTTLKCTPTFCVVPEIQLDAQENISCTGQNDGEITVSSDINAFFVLNGDTSNLDNTALFKNLFKGTYFIEVLAESKSCGSTLEVNLSEPPAILNVAVSNIDQISCHEANDGAINVAIDGGTAPYAVNWTYLQDPSLDVPDSTMINQLAGGDYGLSVTDAHGCTDQLFLQLPTPTAIIVDSASQAETCFGSLNGAASVSLNPNYNNLTVLWDNQARTSTIADLGAGAYRVSVTNDVGCQETRTLVIDSPPEILLAAEEINSASCSGKNDGMATISAQGGIGNLSLQWNDENKQTSTTATQLFPDDYEVVVTDETGCQQTLPITVGALADIILSERTGPITCFENTDGKISLNVSGGTPAYSIKWSDNKNENSISRNDLAAGDYQVTVSDFNDCSTDLAFTIGDKAPIEILSSQDPASCAAADGSIAINIVDGLGDYTFKWEDDDTRITAIAENLRQGAYQVTVTDENGCTGVQMVDLAEKAGIQLVTTATPVVCPGESTGTATVVATGGSGNYLYLWNDQAAQENTTAVNLFARSYTVLVVDDNGCEATSSVLIPDNSNTIDINFDKKDISCFGKIDGQITANLSNTNGNVSYQWSSGESVPSIMNKASGSYRLTITDANNCQFEDTILIIEPDEFFAETMLDPISCPGEANGLLTILPIGGTAPYEYSLDGNRYTALAEFDQLKPGNYSPAVRDANGCPFPLAQVELLEAEPLSIKLNDLKIKAGEPLLLSPIITNGGEELTYTWSGNNLEDLSCIDCPEPLLNPTSSQLYRLKVMDERGCEANANVRVIVEQFRKIFVPTGFSPNHDGRNDRLTVHGVEGTKILSFKIFDRWGELVFDNGDFQVNDEIAGWDGTFKGKDMMTNVFAWIVEVEFPDGMVNMVKGNTTLVR